MKKQDKSSVTLQEQLYERFPTLEKLKKEFAPRPLNVICVEDKYAILRPVTAKEVGVFSMTIASGDGIDTASRYLMQELWLCGDNEIRDDDDYFIAAMLEMQKVIEVKKSDFLKL